MHMADPINAVKGRRHKRPILAIIMSTARFSGSTLIPARGESELLRPSTVALVLSMGLSTALRGNEKMCESSVLFDMVASS